MGRTPERKRSGRGTPLLPTWGEQLTAAVANTGALKGATPRRKAKRCAEGMGREGLEPSTLGLRVPCSTS
jgi:hypothetical protein